MEPKPFINHRAYRWFITSTGKTVVGGKSSIQNDELLRKMKTTRKDFVVMHTSAPGSPFSIILAEKNELSDSDIEETATFTGCFSRAWRECNKKTLVDIFSLSQLYKSSGMKPGTWGVKGPVKKMDIQLELVLTRQEGVLRAVPEKTVQKKKDKLLKVRPGKIDKTEMLPKIQVELKEHPNQDEVLAALPAGGVSIVKK